MRIVYRSLFTDIQKAVNHAAFTGKEIERIEVTQDEFESLKAELGPMCRFGSGIVEHRILGILLVIV
jgi:hypothetical protein